MNGPDVASPPSGDPPPSEGALDGAAGFFEVAYTTRALRRFRPDPIPQDVLFQILDAAIRAPSAGRTPRTGASSS